jgi:hypothetical protein
MKKVSCLKLSILCLSLLCFTSVYSQNLVTQNFADFSKYTKEKFGIEYKMPATFIDMNDRTIFGFSCPGPGMLYSPILKSEDGDCIVLYQNAEILYSFMSRDINSRSLMPQELGVTLKKGIDGATPADVKEHITILDTDKPENVDSVYILRVPNSQCGDSILNKRIPGKEKQGSLTYPYCTGIYIVKKGYYQMCYKLFFTEEGKKSEAQYLKNFFSSMRFPKEARIISKDERGIKIHEFSKSIRVRE